MSPLLSTIIGENPRRIVLQQHASFGNHAQLLISQRMHICCHPEHAQCQSEMVIWEEEIATLPGTKCKKRSTWSLSGYSCTEPALWLQSRRRLRHLFPLRRVSQGLPNTKVYTDLIIHPQWWQRCWRGLRYKQNNGKSHSIFISQTSKVDHSGRPL